jgi:hypothetical protein
MSLSVKPREAMLRIAGVGAVLLRGSSQAAVWPSERKVWSALETRIRKLSVSSERDWGRLEEAFFLVAKWAMPSSKPSKKEAQVASTDLGSRDHWEYWDSRMS